jgi:hypothetical protein
MEMFDPNGLPDEEVKAVIPETEVNNKQNELTSLIVGP